ncbi:glycosyl transferase family 4 [Actinomyces viscosus]|uniref:glycosyl transferase family 4 n=1 Tax=Actinomyces viscosus TaxID=1656 RepID=UPI0028E61D70|nr:glycosyl transferase family 4 [Actinomyces viscosus]
MTIVLLSGIGATSVVSAALTATAIPLLKRAHVIDVPEERSLHHHPVPRGGGLAVVLAVLLAAGTTILIAMRRLSAIHVMARLDVVLMGLTTVLTFALVGFIEDLFSLSVRTRLALQLALGMGLGLMACGAFEASRWWAPMVCVGTTALVNATNFMDGANGLACGHAVTASLWYLLVATVVPVPGLGLVMIAVAGASLGFLPFNAPRARVFLGDSGSYALGGAWAFAVTACLAQGVALEAALAPLLVFLTDTGYTLWMRVRAGQHWYESHKLHVYQRLVCAGWPHWAAALLVTLAAVSCSALAAGSLLTRGPSWEPRVGMATILLLYLSMPSIIGAPSPFPAPRKAG